MKPTLFPPFIRHLITASTGSTPRRFTDSATAEEVVAQAIKGRTPRPYIFTKCERVWNANGTIGARLKAGSGIRQECEDSLRRLHTDVIDLYQIYWPEPDEDIEEGSDGNGRVFEEGRQSSLYRVFSNFSVLFK